MFLLRPFVCNNAVHNIILTFLATTTRPVLILFFFSATPANLYIANAHALYTHTRVDAHHFPFNVCMYIYFVFVFFYTTIGLFFFYTRIIDACNLKCFFLLNNGFLFFLHTRVFYPTSELKASKMQSE